MCISGSERMGMCASLHLYAREHERPLPVLHPPDGVAENCRMSSIEKGMPAGSEGRSFVQALKIIFFDMSACHWYHMPVNLRWPHQATNISATGVLPKNSWRFVQLGIPDGRPIVKT